MTLIFRSRKQLEELGRNATLPKPKVLTEVRTDPNNQESKRSGASKLLGSMKKKSSSKSVVIKQEQQPTTKEQENEDFDDFDLFRPKEDLSQFRPGGSEHRSAEATATGGRSKGKNSNASSSKLMTPAGKTPKKRMMATPSKENCKQQ